jgi:hypothetical protein
MSQMEGMMTRFQRPDIRIGTLSRRLHLQGVER